MIRVHLLCSLLLLLAACASQRETIRLAEDARLNHFLEDVRGNLESHLWEEILATADSAHYAIQVDEMGIPEPQYVAELFGLHRVGNNIGGGDPIQWADLNRIETVHLTSLEVDDPGGWSVRGEALLKDGSRLNVHMMIIPRGQRFRLTGGVG